jgi:hypothetical protein
MSRTYFYFIRNELGETIAEYVSGEIPPQVGGIMNLRPITRQHNNVEVIQVTQFPLPGHTVVKVTVKPASS